jgi:hypothetical protein
MEVRFSSKKWKRFKKLFKNSDGTHRYQDPVQTITIDELEDDDSFSIKKLKATFGVSMLDIIACGLGGVALVAVLHMIIKTPIPPPLSENFILAEIKMEGQGRIGFAIKHNEGLWQHITQNRASKHGFIDAREVIKSAAIAANIEYATGYNGCTSQEDQEKYKCKTTIARLYIQKPAIGKWSIEPYYYDYRKQDGLQRVASLKNASCYYWTRLDEYIDSEKNCDITELRATGKRLTPMTITIDS